MALHRTPLGTLFIVLGALALLAGAILSDVSRLLDPDTFADRAAASLADERVAALAAEALTDAVLAGRRDLTAVRPLIVAASRDVVQSSTFRDIARTAARRAHSTLFSQTGRSVVLSIPDLQLVLRGALAGAPGVAATIPPSVAVMSPEGQNHPALRALQFVVRHGGTLQRFAWIALVVGTTLVAGGVLLMRDRRDALVAAGAALMVAGIGLWASRPVGEAIVAGLVDSPRIGGALAGVANVALAGVPGWGLMYGGIGVVLAAAGSSLLERLDLRHLWRAAARLLGGEPRSHWTRLARGGAIATAGLLAVLAPGAMLSVLVVAGGLLLAFVGLREIFAVVLHATPAHTRLGRAIAESGQGWAVGAVVVVLLAALFAAAITTVSRRAASTRPASVIDACNGASSLCDRRLDEITLAGTHNAMASADVPSWMFPQQERGIVAQLEDGVRALLVDVHYGTPVGGSVRTELTGDARRRDAERVLGPQGVAAAMRVRDRIVSGEEGERGLYLCHAFCELGALPLEPALRDVGAFLGEHPNEVVVLTIEDYVDPSDLARAFEESGLGALAYRGRAGDRWPTLREMIAQNERVVVLLESGRRDVPWMLPAFDVTQETPFTFSVAGDTLSCAPNRGGTAGSLLQLNHWIATTPAPRPSNAAVVNKLDRLLERAARCERARGRRVNVIAVDFYRTGEVMEAVRVLNGIAAGAATGR